MTFPPQPEEPPPVSDLDRELRVIVRRSRRVIWALITGIGAVLVAVSVVVIILVDHQVHQKAQTEKAILSVVHVQCDWYRHWSTVRLPVKPPPSRVLVGVIESARTASHGLGCEPLPPPGKALIRAARKYKIKLTF